MAAQNYFRVADKMEKLEKQYANERDKVIIPLLEAGDLKAARARAGKFNAEMDKKIAGVQEKYDIEFEIDRKKLTIQPADIDRWIKDIKSGERGKPSLERRYKAAEPSAAKTTTGGVGSTIKSKGATEGGIGATARSLK